MLFVFQLISSSNGKTMSSVPTCFVVDYPACIFDYVFHSFHTMFIAKNKLIGSILKYGTVQYFCKYIHVAKLMVTQNIFA